MTGSYAQHHPPEVAARGALRVRAALIASAVLIAPAGLSAQRVERDAGAIFPKDTRAEAIFTDGFFTEGPAMGPDGRLYFSDITFTGASGMQPGYIWRVRPDGGGAEIWRSPSGMSNGLAWDDRGRLLAALGADFGGRAIVRTDPATGRGEILAGLYEGAPLNSPNDLVLDAAGRIYFTDPRYAGHEPVAQPVEGVYRIDPDGAVTRVIDDAGKPNGIVVSPDGGTLYVSSIESLRTGFNALQAWELDDDGAASNPRTLVDFRPDAGADGMALDTDGNLYLARPAADPGVYVYSPAGDELAYLRLQEGPTNVAFGTGEQARTLFITAGPNVYAVPTLRVGYHARPFDASGAGEPAAVTGQTAGMAQQTPRAPVTPDASPGARALLSYLYRLSAEGRLLAGQHDYNSGLGQWSGWVEDLTGHAPVVWGTDLYWSGGEDPGPRVVEEAIRRHRAGHVVTLMWHVGRPTDDPPYPWAESVQAELTDEEWRELTTPGTALHRRWQAQVDRLAGHLARLREAGVPALWRPYHEMNGVWFWWGARPGLDGFPRLWRMLYQRLVEHHGLDNLVWVWNANAPRDIPRDEAGAYAGYYPGHDVVDVLATDVYHFDYEQGEYRQLLELADGRPIALGEVGQLPKPEILDAQPAWTWFMVWSSWIESANTPERVRAVYDYRRTLTLDQVEWPPATP